MIFALDAVREKVFFESLNASARNFLSVGKSSVLTMQYHMPPIMQSIAGNTNKICDCGGAYHKRCPP